MCFFTVPAKPRVLSTSSSDESIAASSANETSVGLNLRLRRLSDGEKDQETSNNENVEIKKEPTLLAETASFHNDWFSVVGKNEYFSTKKYIEEKLGDDFGHSSDSSSDDDTSLSQRAKDSTQQKRKISN